MCISALVLFMRIRGGSWFFALPLSPAYDKKKQVFVGFIKLFVFENLR